MSTACSTRRRRSGGRPSSTRGAEAFRGSDASRDAFHPGWTMPGEFTLIDRIQARATARADVALGIGDGAALLRVPDGQLLAVSTDTLVAGRHFPDDTQAADLGWKALAVNLSDLAAMAAT